MHRSLLALVLVGCIAPPEGGGVATGGDYDVSANLVTSGLDGLVVSGQGQWVRERIVWTDGSNPDLVEHIFVLGDVDVCGTWDSAQVPEVTTDTTGLSRCEAQKEAYAAAAAAHPVVPDTLMFEFDLWDTRDGVEPHIAVEPVAGTFAGLGHSGADDLAVAFAGSRTLFDWNAAYAAALDCAAADPWANVPSDVDAFTRFAMGTGTLALAEPGADAIAFELDDVEVLDDGGGVSPGGVLDGVGVFEACDVVREIEPSDTVDDYTE